MLAKRIIPCLDVRNNQVVKGVQFRNHRVVGDILELAACYSDQGADELVFYDITASSDQRSVSENWVNQVAATLTIPFTVAGGIRTLDQARRILNAGADKISINSPALETPDLIDKLAQAFGSQCVVVGVDSQWVDGDYYVYQYTGDEGKSQNARRRTCDWLKEVQERGAGEVVLNCMRADGMRTGYDRVQLTAARELLSIPLIASGGAGDANHFVEVFQQCRVDGALAASIFHEQRLSIADVKKTLAQHNIEVRPC
ncbi:imidazole glycerol phosphate synthase subunit HisF [Legionella taurinensis]|uniref:Imidazole glycerol phosphate synthase subunit HisF n=1 Tax=Legionella taurinensis TaxID=70611 RepID=A0A3A5LFI3_9GAMM|nr:imidazole glycerol phosphate synthase subunit HisF [Legionella taurinensis]MDX1836974.1 imidazole glycerol phosphate synthase subunit HisF [Legionella taurinensis]PUT41382.1 imidazole glycerol phosphate synthase subunit HisF [Legionella taurinensis]PUT42621.1 imidazole glycerol phosphate synthase subunit HisF [Legionella taurinensis]PUT46649.1 imidazole glycerol phosphate synthase subunit HisF [Legionella taurinensis]PUT47298.1 imidazole glycerol phosphate synthase subunit HisF [Legionella 